MLGNAAGPKVIPRGEGIAMFSGSPFPGSLLK